MRGANPLSQSGGWEPFFDPWRWDNQQLPPLPGWTADASRGLMAVLVVLAAAAGWVFGAGAIWPPPAAGPGAHPSTAGYARVQKKAAPLQATVWGQPSGQGETLWEVAGSGPLAGQPAPPAPSVASPDAAGSPPVPAPSAEPRPASGAGVAGAVHQVEQGETLWDIARLYGVSVERIAQANDLADPHRITAGQRLTIPGASAPRRPRLVVNGRLQRALQWPVRGGISSQFGRRWGRMHEGVDIRVPPGTPVRAAAGGRVVFAGWNGGYGYLVIVDHGQGVHTYYAHNRRVVVREGQQVSRGQVLAYSGSTGHTTGPHLHFEVRLNGRPLNPVRYLR